MGVAGEEESLQEGKEERIFVSVRLRPLNEKEIARNEDVSDWECINDNTIIYKNNLSVAERSMYPTAYTVDRVFSPDCFTRKVYEEGAKEVALSVVSGMNSTVFAYGQTSSGKTYTMSGITEYTMDDIYDYVEKHKDRNFTLKFSALEIYNESVRDLLSEDSTPLRLLDDPERGTIVEKLTEEALRDKSHFKELLSICEAQRQIGETSLNEMSSRSHQILRVTVESSAREFSGKDKLSSLTANVNFVDLAGSERASQALSAGTRLKEGCHINRSLLTLGTVIRKLSKGRNGHIPYRDSKLTRILQSSLGGNARTAIICTLSPARIHVEQSRNTLLFATCAKEVTTNAQVNIVMSDKALVKHLQRELARLESELSNSGTKSVPRPDELDYSALLREKDTEIEKLKKEVSELNLQLELAHAQIEDMRQQTGKNTPASALQESVDLQYPKLRVRSGWDCQKSQTSVLSSPSCIDVSVRSPSTYQYSDGDTRCSDDENFFRLLDFEENYSGTSSSHQHHLKVGASSSSSVGTDQQIEAHNDENIEQLCRVVRCLEMAETERANSEVEFSPFIYGHVKEPSTLANQATPERTEVENNDQQNQEPVVLQEKTRRQWENVQAGFIVASSTNQPEYIVTSSSNQPGLDAKLSSTDQPGFAAIPSSVDRPGFLATPSSTGRAGFPLTSSAYQSPWIPGKDSCSPCSLKLRRSSSCKAQLMCNSYLLENAEKYESTPPSGFVKDFTGRPGSMPKRFLALKYALEAESLSRNESHSPTSVNSKDHKEKNVETSSEVENTRPLPAVITQIEEVTDSQNEKQLPAQPVSAPKSIGRLKNVRDIGLDPIVDDLLIPSMWTIEFKKVQREIIELWHFCNVSLAHRSYFFLLFKGDPKDSIYMEVEHRRMTFMKESFSRGTPTIVDGRTMTPASSLKALRQEMQMLAYQMQKKFSKEERESLFVKWGIDLQTKDRRLQLANRLWTDTKDMNHIADSASVVSKLVNFVKPEFAFKEMFGLSFAPKRSSWRFKLWKNNSTSIL